MDNQEELKNKLIIALAYLCSSEIRHCRGTQEVPNIEHLREAIECLIDVQAAFFPEPEITPCRVIKFNKKAKTGGAAR